MSEINEEPIELNPTLDQETEETIQVDLDACLEAAEFEGIAIIDLNAILISKEAVHATNA